MRHWISLDISFSSVSHKRKLGKDEKSNHHLIAFIIIISSKE